MTRSTVWTVDAAIYECQFLSPAALSPSGAGYIGTQRYILIAVSRIFLRLIMEFCLKILHFVPRVPWLGGGYCMLWITKRGVFVVGLA